MNEYEREYCLSIINNQMPKKCEDECYFSWVSCGIDICVRKDLMIVNCRKCYHSKFFCSLLEKDVEKLKVECTKEDFTRHMINEY